MQIRSMDSITMSTHTRVHDTFRNRNELPVKPDLCTPRFSHLDSGSVQREQHLRRFRFISRRKRHNVFSFFVFEKKRKNSAGFFPSHPSHPSFYNFNSSPPPIVARNFLSRARVCKLSLNVDSIKPTTRLVPVKADVPVMKLVQMFLTSRSRARTRYPRTPITPS